MFNFKVQWNPAVQAAWQNSFLRQNESDVIAAHLFDFFGPKFC